MLGNGNGNGSARPPNSRRPGQSNNVQAQVAANHHHQQHIQEHNQHQHQLNHHNQHHQNIYVHPAGGSQGHSAVRSNMDPPSTATGAGARNRQHQNHHPAQGSHHPSGARYPPPVAAAASNEHDLANPQNEQHHGGFHSAAVDTESYPSHSQGNSQVLDRHDTITPPKVGTLICVKGGKKSVIDLTPREYTIGRSVDCDVVLTSLECSKRHCRIFVLAEPSQQPQVDGAPTCVWMIQDLSTNGTFVNGKRIPKNQPLPLYSGDLLEIKVGNYFEFSSLHAMYPDPNEELKDPEYSVIHDKYLLTRKLGSGTYASVYLTQELATGRRYACKVVNKRKAGLSERQTSNKLVQEIEVIRHFNHPNIIRVHNCIETRLYLYVVMDLAQSGELFDYLAAQYGIEETKCKLIMYQIFKGLKYLHENKVVHRDIKPENILLDFSGEFPRVMLADFGLAKRRNTEGPERMTTLCGTLNYLAPEVINPPVRAQGYDDVVDCWAAGIMLFFLLTCRHPFDDENDTKLKKKILRDELKLYAPASDGGNLFDHLSPEVADLIHQLLARNPAERLSAAAALKHPWFMSSITELKTAYKAVHQSWEAQAHRAPPSALTTAEPISAGELFSQSQAVASQLSQGHPEDEQESDLATVGVSAQQPWVPDEDADDAMDEDSPGSLQSAGYSGMPPASASLLPGQFVGSQPQPSELHQGINEFFSQHGAGTSQLQQQDGHGFGYGHLTSAPLDRQGSVIPPPGHGSSPPPAGGSSFLDRQSSMSQPGPAAHQQGHANPSSPTQYSSKFAANMSNYMSQQSQQLYHQQHPQDHGLQHSPSFSESWSQSQGFSSAHQGGFSAAGRYSGTSYPSFGAGSAPAQGTNMPPVPHGNHQQQRKHQQFS